MNGDYLIFWSKTDSTSAGLSEARPESVVFSKKLGSLIIFQ
jgi:hypothetical protein